MSHHGYPSLAARAAGQGWLKWAVLLSASFGAILEVIDTSIVNVALPDMQGNLNATLSEIGWVSTGYSMANVVIIPLTAWLGQRFGKKSYFLFSLLAFVVASVACGLATNLATLITARVLQGLGGGGLLAKAQSILFETFPREEQGMASAVFGLGVISGPAIGPALGGYLTDTWGWRWIFFINIPFGMLALWMCSTFLPADLPMKKGADEVDWLGIMLLTLGLASLQAVLEQGQQEDWYASDFIRFFSLLSASSLLLFVWQELRTPHPAVDLRVLRYPSLALGSFFSVILGMALYGTLFAIPVFVQSVLHFTAYQTGVLLIPGAAASAAAMLLLGRLSKHLDPRMMIGVGVLITAAVMFSLARLSPDTGEKQLFLPLIFRGFGTVLMFLPLSIVTLGPIPKADIPSSSGFFSLTRQLGGSLGIALITTLVSVQASVHRSEMVYHLNQGHSAWQQRIEGATQTFSRFSSDSSRIHQQALTLIDHALNAQAAILSYIDLFHGVTILLLLCLPLLFLPQWEGAPRSG